MTEDNNDYNEIMQFGRKVLGNLLHTSNMDKYEMFLDDLPDILADAWLKYDPKKMHCIRKYFALRITWHVASWMKERKRKSANIQRAVKHRCSQMYAWQVEKKAADLAIQELLQSAELNDLDKLIIKESKAFLGTKTRIEMANLLGIRGNSDVTRTYHFDNMCKDIWDKLKEVTYHESFDELIGYFATRVELQGTSHRVYRGGRNDVICN